MTWQRFGICVAVAAGIIAGASPLCAQASAASAAGSAPANPSSEKAVVVLVGVAGSDAELRALLRELLESRGVATELLGQPGFVKDDLLRAVAEDDAVHVFIVPGAAGNVGLYFRRPDGERFLVRNVLLRGGLDDVGREQVGQIVETAVASLLHSTDGLTREQTQLALAAEGSPAPVSTPPTETPVASSAPRSASPPKRSPPSSATRLEGWLGLRYGAAALGSPLGVAHGPGLELGVGLRRGWVLRGRFTAQRDFTQTLTTPLIGAEFDSLRWRLVVDAGVTLTDGQALLASVGAGQDHSAVVPRTAPGSSVTPAAKLEDTATVAHAELRYEVGSASFRVGGALGVDASFVKTHFDVSRSGEREVVVRPWLVRPTASLSLAFCPSFTKI